MKIGNKLRVEIEKEIRVRRIIYCDCVDDNIECFLKYELNHLCTIPIYVGELLFMLSANGFNR